MNKEFKEILENLEKAISELDDFNYSNFDSDSENGKQIEKAYGTIRDEISILHELDI